VWHFKFFYYNISLKNVPLFNKSPFLAMDNVQTEIRSGNVQLDKVYSLYLIECILGKHIFSYLLLSGSTSFTSCHPREANLLLLYLSSLGSKSFAFCHPWEAHFFYLSSLGSKSFASCHPWETNHLLPVILKEQILCFLTCHPQWANFFLPVILWKQIHIVEDEAVPFVVPVRNKATLSRVKLYIWANRLVIVWTEESHLAYKTLCMIKISSYCHCHERKILSRMLTTPYYKKVLTVVPVSNI